MKYILVECCAYEHRAVVTCGTQYTSELKWHYKKEAL